MILACILWLTSYAAQALRAGAKIAVLGGLRAEGRPIVATITVPFGPHGSGLLGKAATFVEELDPHGLDLEDLARLVLLREGLDLEQLMAKSTKREFDEKIEHVLGELRQADYTRLVAAEEVSAP